MSSGEDREIPPQMEENVVKSWTRAEPHNGRAKSIGADFVGINQNELVFLAIGHKTSMKQERGLTRFADEKLIVGEVLATTVTFSWPTPAPLQ